MRKEASMPIVNPHAAGIDIGSKSHYVAVGQSMDQTQEFSVYSSGQKELIAYLKTHDIRTVAMESTGSYWPSLFRVIQEAGFEVILVPGNQIQTVRGKTDVMDCQWIQKLHSLGLLRGCYLPGELTDKIRTLNRHRKSLIEDSSRFINRIQKSLRLMNLRLDVVISNIIGKSGRAIIEAIIRGERDPDKLALLANSRVRRSKAEISDALHGQYQDELMYELKENYSLLQIFDSRIKDCDNKIEALLEEHTKKIKLDPSITLANKQHKGRNQGTYQLNEFSYKMFGVDLFQIEGISVNTVLTFISEVGLDIYKFESPKQFASWLRLSPNNKISGGKIISSKSKKGKNRLAIAFRDAANTIENKKSGSLVNFFKRIAYRKGRAAAITATARKIAVIIWTMITKKVQYQPQISENQKEKIKTKKIKTIIRLINEFQISTTDLQSPKFS